MPVLSAHGIRKRFGGVVALNGAEFSLDAGEVHALLGSNGCGKSTLCKIIAGSVDADAGELLLDGKPVSFANPAAAAAAGIEMFYQELSLIPAMTVAENIYLGREPRGRDRLVDRGRMRADAAQLVAGFGKSFGQGADADTIVSELSADQRQIVEMLKVLARQSRIIVFDEATAALDRDQVELVFAQIRALKAQGHAVVFISHRMDEVFEIADRITVMRDGVTVSTTPTAETTREQVVLAMVGAAGTPAAMTVHHKPGAEAVLSVENLSAGRLKGVSLTLRRGEIVGLGGLHRQGQSDLLRALYGILPVRSGEIALRATRYQARGPAPAIRRSIAYVSGDRARNGVMAVRPIFENLVLSLLARDHERIVARTRLARKIQPFVDKLRIKLASFDAPVNHLSGGNQQKVVIARLLATEPAILLLDDPSKGIDLGTKSDLYTIMDELCAQGISILLYSSDDKELLAIADRVLVFNAGRIVAELKGDDKTEMALYRAAYLAEKVEGDHV